jgi:hypothetical protein
VTTAISSQHNFLKVLPKTDVLSRFVNYRSYKFDFSGYPVELPRVEAKVAATLLGDATIAHVSWNGATEVDTWRFYAAGEEDENVILGSVKKDGFETRFACMGFYPVIFAEGLDVTGKSLGNSTIQALELPLGWHDDDLETLFTNIPYAESGPDAGAPFSANATNSSTDGRKWISPWKLVLVSFLAGLVAASYGRRISRGGHRLVILIRTKFGGPILI